MLLRPGADTQEVWFLFPGIDKVIHMAIFMVLAFCFLCAYPKTKFITFFQVMLIYAILTEVLQSEMGLGRSMEFYDLLADTAGYLAGYFLFIRTKAFSNIQK